MEHKEKITLTEEKETLLITLYAKALDYRAKRSVLRDKTANDILTSLDYDFNRIKKLGNNVTVIRAKQFDNWTKEFLEENHNCVVVCLGCGLDARVNRVEHHGVRWFDVDYAEVIALRKNFFTPGNGYQMIASSVTDESWLQQIPNTHPVLIVAEGLLEYLTIEEVTTLFHRITDYFSQGEIVFDVMNSFAIRSGKQELKKNTGAVHKWAVDKIAQVDAIDAKLKRVNSIPIFRSKFMGLLPIRQRMLFGVLSLFRQFRTMMRLMRYKF